MILRPIIAAAALGAVCAGLIQSVVAADAPLNAPAAAFPRGHYAALNKLPDWGGVWVLNFPAPGSKRERPQLQGQFLADYEAWQKAVETSHGQVPRNGSYCRPPGMPGIMGVGQYPIEFLFTPGRVTIHHEAWMQWRNVYTDGRGHPDDWDATFYGHSTGHWEGDTLVVDTVGIKTVTELSAGMKHSPKLHIVERIHLAKGEPDTLVDEMTAEDALALAQPWHNTLTFHRARDMDLLEFICAENDRNPVDEQGHTEFK
ncbi:MAG TPA: hypothetical protein VLW26_07675 [Steroidobacteraceae bacterium]|nr:hypothetical protein [Steroidobacteraceae bacterium]